MSVRDQTRNIETFKIQGNEVNEYEFHKHQGEMTEQSDARPGNESNRARVETQAERVERLTREAHEKVARKTGKKPAPARATTGRPVKSAGRSAKRKTKAKSPATKSRNAAKKTTKKVAKKSSRKR